MCLKKFDKNGSLGVVLAMGVFLGGALFCMPALAQQGGDYPNNGDSPGNMFGQAYNESALPQDDATLDSRNPGMTLPTGASQDYESNPFLEAPEPPQKTQAEIEAEVRSRSFNAAINGLLPLNPGEIRKLLKRYDETQQAVEIPLYPYPKPEVAIETVSLDPGVTPPIIKAAVGQVTTLNMMDATGQPWPIQDISWAGDFQVVQPEEGSHVLRITPLKEFAYGNISLRMLELNTPVTFTVKTQRDIVQYRFDARIPEFGPFAQEPIIEGGLSIVAGTPILNSILDGVPPEGAEKLEVSGVDGRTTAYNYNLLTYVRTPFTLLSPGWSHSVSSADGMNVYTMAEAPILLLSDHGRVVRARLSKKESSDE
jgi:intracellular multiplication protein IcmK